LSLRAWRIVKARWAADAFSGEGARRHQGRWNHCGTPMIYAAGSLSLVALEILANVRPSVLQSGFVAIPITFDDSLCLKLEPGQLPRHWNPPAATAATRTIGSIWARDLTSVLLAVPSSVIPIEVNYLVNPLHSDFQSIDIGSPDPFQFDARLLGGSS
jgi:RES domain-containing protein